MNWRNRFSLIALATMLACAKSDGRVAVVSAEDYSSRACWFNQNGDAVAFLIIAIDGGVAVPYVVSAKCLVSGDYASLGEAILHHLNTVRIIDRLGRLQRSFPSVTMSSNLLTDQPVPTSASRLYYLKARVENIPHISKTLYRLDDILELQQVNMSFERFLGLSRDERQVLLSEYE